MTNIPVQVEQDLIVSVVVILVGYLVGNTFKWSKTLSLLVAKVFVEIGYRLLKYCKKCYIEHSKDIEKSHSDWHILKSKIKNGKIGIG